MPQTSSAYRRLTTIACRWQVTDITYIRTHEGFLYLAVVIDLFSRRVVGWSMQGRTYTDLPLQALLMAVWRRKPKTKVQVHSSSRALLRNTLPGSGSRLTIHQLRVARIPRTAQSDAKHEPPLGGFALQIACRAMVAGIVGIMRCRRASLTCSNANASAVESIKPAPKLARTCSTTSSFSTIHSANTLGTACCHRSLSNSSKN